ncbi:phosphotransferase [Ornithinibacillus sp. L9]|uniref:Phosphotransferase n=1 Tax=Ornithinibacillus caprae TaxID=2678566 RepID=A0A6N8FHS7_9BACI|nr:aminoglycoside phosphotransferase family protein [Ornithinibacillus caprae]MUK87804.1 phosphotransferase [Ornithinibacillus caprae]
MKVKDDIISYLLEYNPHLKNATSVKQLEKGFSHDKKYIIDDSYLLRTFTSEDEARRKQEFEVIKLASNYSTYVPKAIEFNTVHDFHTSYMLLTYLPGEDGEEALSKLTEEEQYNAGYVAGVELKKLHQVNAPADYPSWYSIKKKKSEKYLQELKDISIEEQIKELLEAYIHKHEHLMLDRPNTFQHDDFHPSNLLIKDKEFAGIIDFQRMDWGDPVHDLHKLGFFSKHVSIEFTKGIIDGYHNHNVTDEFWKLYALYSAMHVVSAIVWGNRQGPESFEKLLIYSLEVIEDHDSFRNIIPKWYDSSR